MASLISTVQPREESGPSKEEEENATGGPIGALVIAIPISLLLWGVIFILIFNLVH